MEASKQLSKCQIFSSGVSLDIKPLLTCPASEQMPPQPISPFCGSTIQSLLMLLPPPPRDQGQDHSTSAGMRHVSILLSQAAALRGSQRPLRRGDRWFLLSAESSAAQQRAAPTALLGVPREEAVCPPTLRTSIPRREMEAQLH